MRQQNNLKLEDNKHILYICGGAAFVLIATLFVLNFLHIFTVNSANAESTASKSTDMAVTLQPTLEIWTTDTTDTSIASLNIAADPDAAVYTGTVRAHVSTNNETGYTLTMTSSAASAAMVSEDTTRTIAPISGTDVTTASWRSNASLNNQWAFSIGSSDAYNPVVGSGDTASELNTTSAAINDSTTDVVFGAKVDESLPAGSYTNTVIFSAVANAPVPTTQYMQDVDYATWCNSSDVQTFDTTSAETMKATTYELVDSRTDEPYYIRKLSDGKCWMVENLYLPSAYTLTTEASNVTSNYSLPESSESGFSDNTAKYMFIGGRNRDGYKQKNNNPADGSYFSWVAAKAGTASGITSDVCPKNWRLPTNTEQSTVAGWGYTNFDQVWWADADGGNNTATPIYPGYYSNSTLYYDGTYAYWWSSTQYSSTSGYYLGRYGTNLATDVNYKRLGYSVRCLLSS